MVIPLAAEMAEEVAREPHGPREVASLVAGAAVGIVGLDPLRDRLRGYPDEELATAAVEFVERVAAEHREVERALLAGPLRRRASAA